MPKRRNIVALGPRSVGKSALLIRFTRDQFVDLYYPTIQSSFCTSIEHQGDIYDCEIIDTAGLDTYSLLNFNYLIGTHGYILLYSVASRRSFDMMKIIYDKVVDDCGISNMPFVVVGTKLDLQRQRQVDPDEAEAFASRINAAWIETSAKNGENIDQVFTLCLAEIERCTTTYYHQPQSEPRFSSCVAM